MRSSTLRRQRRALAVSAAAGLLALSGPALPAAAQTGTIPMPPPLSDDRAGGGSLGPEGGYEQTSGCMQGNPGASSIEGKPWGQLTLGFEQARQQTAPNGAPLTGRDTRVAVIDTGVNEHPRLGSVDGSGGSSAPGGATTDCDGHGTIVAGIIAARPDPTGNDGFVGVAPDATIMSIRQSSKLFQNKALNKTLGDVRTMAQAINFAAAHGAKVINISQSSCMPIAQAADPSNKYNQMLHNAVKDAVDGGAVVVSAAGNADSCQKNAPGSPTTAVLPAWFDDDVLTVASVNQQGAPSEFTVPGPWVDVAAPGENITSIDPGVGGRGLANQLATGQGGQMGPIQGTSFAAPYVSGLAALIKQKYPEMPARQVMDRIKQTALSPGGDGGRNDIVGYGLVNPMAALDNVVPSEYAGVKPAKAGKDKRANQVDPGTDWPALMVALSATGAGIGAVIFTAFLTNAVRKARARRAGDTDSEL